jgi:hypothetical protein
MAQRAALPQAAVTITPGYSWQLDLDIAFDGERPDDWDQWVVRMHVYSETVRFTLKPGDGVTFEAVPDLPNASAPVVIPIIRMSAARTESLRDAKLIHYTIDLKAPGDEAEDYFAGSLSRVPGPPAELLA